MLKNKKGQNLVEVVLIIPLLLVILLALMEYALFQRNVNAVQDIAEEAATAASKLYVSEYLTPQTLTNPGTLLANLTLENPAAAAAFAVARRRVGAIGANSTFTYHDIGSAYGERPFALYEFISQETTTYKGSSVPRYTFTVDYRDPYKEGVSTQLIYHYNLVLFGLEFTIPGVNKGRPIVIIPHNVQISSTQTHQYINY